MTADRALAGWRRLAAAGRLPAAHVRVLLLSAVLVLVAVACYVTSVHHLGTAGAPLRVPWLLLATGFAVAETAVIHLEFRRDAHSVSLNEIPLVLALVFATPGQLLSAQLVGAALALVVHRRQPLLKLVFNVSHFALEDCVALLVFHAALQSPGHLGPHLWGAAIAAGVAAGVVSVVTVSFVIWLHQNRFVPGQLATVLGVALLGALVNSCLALVAATVLWVDVRGGWLLLVVAAILVLAYRAYASLHQRHASLELLYEFTRAVSGAGDAERIVANVLSQARELLRAEVAELAILPEGDQRRVDWLTLEADGTDAVRTEEPEVHQAVKGLDDNPRPLVMAKSTRDTTLRSYLVQRGQRDCLLAPLRADNRTIGVLAVANRMGDVTTFDGEDARLFETIATHASMALQNARLVDRLRHEALHDSLTGLANRVLFQQRVTELVARRRPADPKLAVMLMDLDRFKDINDALGHQTGDLLLQEVAARLRRGVDQRVTVARLGGDEFAMLHPGFADGRAAEEAAGRIREELQRPFEHDGLSLEVGATIGVALAPDDGEDATTLLRRADIAMYSAKGTAVGVALYRDELDEHSPRRLALVGQLRHAIESGGLELHYQPKARLDTGEIVGVEALVRWRHPDEGYIPPDEFVPLAERTGLIASLTTHVLHEALAQCRRWSDAGLRLTVAVNLSARSLLDVDLASDVARVLHATGVDPSLLVLEITETSVMADAGRTLALLERLAAMGVTLAVDDFGTGYSSLSYLKRLPAQEVKIDKSFVLNMQHDDNDAAIVRSIVDLARNLGMRVVAEGVEDGRTWQLLRELGCDVGQGYHLSRPLPAGRLTAWLRTAPNTTAAPGQ